MTRRISRKLRPVLAASVQAHRFGELAARLGVHALSERERLTADGRLPGTRHNDQWTAIRRRLFRIATVCDRGGQHLKVVIVTEQTLKI